MQRRKSNTLAPFFLLAMMAAYVLVFSYASIMRWASFNSSLDDMGIMIQTLHTTTRGHLLVESVNLGVPLSRLWLAHVELIYLPLALIYAVIHRPETLLVLQSLFLAAGALPVYWMARDRLHSPWAGVAFAAAYLLYPAMHNTNLFDVHGIVFATSLLLYMFYFLDRQRRLLFFLFALLALLCREDIAVTLGMVGAYMVLVKKQTRSGIVIGVIGVVWFGTIYFIRPLLVTAFDAVDPEVLAGITRTDHWAHLQGGRLLLERPLYFLDEYFLTGLNAKYLFWLLAPVAFLSLFSPLTLSIAGPILLINMTSRWLPTHLIEYQYTATITPVVFVSAIYGLENLLAYMRKNERPVQSIQRLALFAVLLFAAGTSFAKSNLRKLPGWQIGPRHERMHKIAQSIPESASLCADMVLGTHAAERYELYGFPDNYLTADYVFYDLGTRRVRLMSRTDFMLANALPDNKFFRDLLYSQEHAVVAYDDGIILFKRSAPRSNGIRKLVIAEKEEIVSLVQLAVNEHLLFLGYTRHADVEYHADTTYAHFTLYWALNAEQATGTSGDGMAAKPDQRLAGAYRLTGSGWHRQVPWQPAFGRMPPASWQAGEIIREHVYWPIINGRENDRVKVAFQDSTKNQSVELFTYTVGQNP